MADRGSGSFHFQLYTSNRLERLLEAWVRRLRETPLPPMEREIVVVQSQGMRRFLTLELARRRGIAAGLWLPFPRDLARCLTEAVLDAHLSYERGQEELGLFDREILLWRLFALLGEAAATPGHALRVPAAYLLQDPDQRKRFQLSARLAALFDDYQLFRGDWLRDFEAGRPLFPPEDPRQDTAAWQAYLWRRLHHPGAGDSLARRLERTIEILYRGWDAKNAPRLPPRITVFGVSSLPPVFLELLRAASCHLEVELYFASPTWHYWGDLFSDREQVRLARRFRRSSAAPAAIPGHLERGNSLLSGLGQQGRDFFNLLQELDESGESWHDVDFEEPGQDSLLHCLQSDILHLRDRSVVDPPLPLPETDTDGSLRVHICHSPLREMEVLREELLRALDELPDLHPSGILVLLPEIEKYAPLIDAVFGVAHEGAPALPYSVADRQLASTQKPAAALLALLELVHQRLTVAEVFGLLESPAIRRAAGIEETELTQLRQRVEDTHIRWAIDGRQREEDFDLPRFEENSWQAGIDRLLFGYAIGPSLKTSFGVAPQAGDAAGDTDLLGRFLLFLDRLFVDLRGLKNARPPAQWSRDLVALVGRQLEASTEDEELALQLLRDSFARLEEIPRLATLEALPTGAGPRPAGQEPELPLEVIRQYLRRVLAEDQASGGFLAGGITFCALRPMRSIPFEVVAIAGMDDASFPRRDPPRVLDLLALAPRPGDRSPRLDDRYLFLETLLAARRRLLLFYPGANQRDAGERAPSVVLSELLDLVDRTFVSPDERPCRQHLVVHHPLQAWSSTNFGPQPRSSSRENAAACAALAGPKHDLPPFFTESDATISAAEESPEEGPEENSELQLDQLLEALSSPGRFYCRHVLELRLGRDEEEAPETELFELATLPRFGLLQQMIAARLSATQPDGGEELELLRARFELPPALLGEALYRRLVLDAESLIGRLPPGLPGTPLDLPFEIAGTNYVLRGQLSLSGRHLLLLRPASLRPRDLLRAYLETLVAQIAAPETFQSAYLLGQDGGCELRPFTRQERARTLLADLVALYREIRRRPLPLFEQASFTYAELMHRQLDPRKKKLTGSELEAAARRAFEGRRAYENQQQHGPRGDRDAEIDLLWRGRDPLTHAEFGPLALRVFRPLLECRRELKT